MSYFVLTAWDKAITWKDVEWLAANTSLPVIVKGLLSADDAQRARSMMGRRARIVSNHGEDSWTARCRPSMRYWLSQTASPSAPRCSWMEACGAGRMCGRHSPSVRERLCSGRPVLFSLAAG